jgi:hypothetical protein
MACFTTSIYVYWLLKSSKRIVCRSLRPRAHESRGAMSISTSVAVCRERTGRLMKWPVSDVADQMYLGLGAETDDGSNHDRSQSR